MERRTPRPPVIQGFKQPRTRRPGLHNQKNVQIWTTGVALILVHFRERPFLASGFRASSVVENILRKVLKTSHLETDTKSIQLAPGAAPII